MMWMARHLADIFDVFDSHMKGFVRDKRPVGRVVGKLDNEFRLRLLRASTSCLPGIREKSVRGLGMVQGGAQRKIQGFPEIASAFALRIGLES